ncbi:MAG: hypothetical protein KKF21_16595, partial [Bacteroidetes bacterium]|nr:hypothetical protein [Bacteroidota bacterium]MBU1799992.1 hypothetical protein [Bacteroidota bacterium]
MKKQMPLLYVILFVGMILSSMLIAQTATVPAGTGTVGDPYQITSVNNLYWMSQNTNLIGKYYTQMNDIDASSTTNWDDPVGGTKEGFVPIGTSSAPFRGYFDGQNYTINGLYINRSGTNAIGLFGYTNSSSYYIKNVKLTTVNIKGNNSVGGIIGSNAYTPIENCSVTGDIYGYGNSVGGVAGENYNATITSCYSTADVTGVESTGGLVGLNAQTSGNTALIEKSYYAGVTVDGKGNFVGGLVGKNNDGTITECFSTGNVLSIATYVAGLAGVNNGSDSHISNSYSKVSLYRYGGGALTTYYYGAFVGRNYSGTIENCYSTGSITFDDGNGTTPTNAGFVGDSYNGIETNNFWDNDVSNQSTATGATSATTAEMKNSATFISGGWDFVTETTNGLNNYWDDDVTEAINGGYMPLAWQAGTDGILNGTPSGTGTSGDPYLIATLDNLIWITQNTDRWEEYFKQTANIDASSTVTLNSGAGLVPIGNTTTQFTGFYDGQNYSISNLTINRPATQYVGLFGYTSGSAEISDLNLLAVSITGDDYVGGLVGYAYGNLITNCSVAGSVTGDDYTGGLIGANSDNTVTNSYSTANVTGGDYVGGLIGWEFSSTIRANYATGSVSSSSNDAGGLIGYAEASTISNCYSKGNVTRSIGTSTNFGAFIGQVSSDGGASSISHSYSIGSVYYTGTTAPTDKGFVGYDNTTGGANTYTNNLWDNDASNQSTATGATSKTTVEMKDYRTYTTAGWDFNYETTNGSNSYWDDDQLGTVNSFYPILYWQAGANDETYGQPSLGDGTEGNPYQISTLNNLYWLSKNTSVWSKYFVQTQTIDASSTSTWHNGLGFEPIGQAPKYFEGNWTGNFDEVYIINALSINRPNENNVGFFGRTNYATIKYLEISHSDISGYEYVGSLVGNAADMTNIQYCFSTDGTVSGYLATGGLIGANYHVNIFNSKNSSNVTGTGREAGGLVGYFAAGSTSYKISECSNTGSVSGTSYVGGLAGRNGGSAIEKSYSTGNVSGSSSLVGGFVGDNNSAITNCYSKGNVTRGSGATDERYGSFAGIARNGSNFSYCYSTGSVIYTDATNPTTKGFAGLDEGGTFTANFFDSETSSQSTGTGATAKTTALMKTNSTFVDAGWDINIWNIDASWNSGYPYFDWQNSGGTALPVELTSFTANLVDGKVELNWETATEVNNYGFDVETLRATSDEWETIGFVQGSGNSNSPKNYTFVDENPSTDSAEYRLKQIDTDGNYSYYSETVKVAGFGIMDVNDNTLPTEYKLSQNYP